MVKAEDRRQPSRSVSDARPTKGLALAATVGDWTPGKRAAVTLALGCALAVAAGMVIGAMVTIDPSTSELRNRTLVQPADMALALACDAARVLAFSRGASLCGWWV